MKFMQLKRKKKKKKVLSCFQGRKALVTTATLTSWVAEKKKIIIKKANDHQSPFHDDSQLHIIIRRR